MRFHQFAINHRRRQWNCNCKRRRAGIRLGLTWVALSRLIWIHTNPLFVRRSSWQTKKMRQEWSRNSFQIESYIFPVSLFRAIRNCKWKVSSNVIARFWVIVKIANVYYQVVTTMILSCGKKANNCIQLCV